MIAIWMTYSMITGAMLSGIAWLLERVARSRGLPMRGIWIGAMMVTLALSAAAVIPGTRPATAPSVPATFATAGVSPANAGGIGRGVAGSRGSVVTVRERARRMSDAIDAQITAGTARLSPLNNVLAAAWIALTIALAAVVTHAVIGGRRMKRGLAAREIDGTPVLMTESIGPAAIGIGDRAILLPKWAAGLEPALLRLIVRHEREHLTARDPALLLAGLFAVVLMPWHVALWWNWRRLRLAVEVDCDSRVLRAYPDVQTYGRLLLLTCQRTIQAPWTSLPMFTVVAPLQPRASQLAQRIAIMTSRGTARSGVATVGLLAGTAVAGTIVLMIPAPRPCPPASGPVTGVARTPLLDAPPTTERSNVAWDRARREPTSTSASASTPAPAQILAPSSEGADGYVAERERYAAAREAYAAERTRTKSFAADTEPDDARFDIVHATRLGLYNVPSDPERGEILGEILIYADGPARVSVGLDPLMPLTGTLHLKRLPRINADVTESNVYIELTGPGSMSLGGTFAHDVGTFGANGTRIMLMKGGMGVGTPRQ
jgi:beta-lactamase regulating signal transducer with metallopeptidase domain